VHARPALGFYIGGWLTIAFRLAGEPRVAACPAPLSDPPGHPAARPCGFAALLKLPGTLANSLRSDTASIFFPAALRYSPAQMGFWVRAMLWTLSAG